MKEEWKPINLDGEETGYHISNFGRVRYVLYKNSKKDGFVKPRPTKTGYMRACIRHKGRKVERYIHRLVAEAFIENPEDKQFVNHIDGDKSNNSVENLEWVTRFENMRHCFDNELSPIAKPVILYTLKGEYYGEFVSVSEALRVVAPRLESTTGIDSRILNVKDTKPRQAQGFQWRLRDGDSRPVKDISNECKLMNIKVVRLTMNGEYLDEFNSISDACRFLNVINNGLINQACKNNKKSAHGFKWIYYSDYLAKYKKI